MTRQVAAVPRRAVESPGPTVVARLALTVPEVSAQLGIPQRAVRQLIHNGQLRAKRVGPRFVVPVAAINEFLADAS